MKKKNYEEIADRVYRHMHQHHPAPSVGWTLDQLSDRLELGHMDVTGALFLLERQGRAKKHIPGFRQKVRWNIVENP